VLCEREPDHGADAAVSLTSEFDELPALLGIDVGADVCSLCNLAHSHASYCSWKFCK
jgi:hypothetical protein